ncbi:rhombotarget lipoprotein [Opitutus sp. ER46]|uniref:rhombotarget lipoprotein n=1 Tax=Opitutus sp. ER46 TaxID=2161864 RepID=UPI000D2FADAF|nr:rhombotarget lipoprotein [Opitutus sp. ER46]PTX98603.1 rhombotarget lipoprotein [Opitutus sp. ER46]
MNTPLVRLGLVSAAMLTAVVAFSGCASFFRSSQQAQRSSSVVTYLYPKQANPVPPTAIPVLRLPLRVGIAFVPAGGTTGSYRLGAGLTEMQKTQLMRRVADQFRGLDYIERIEIIPSTYLRPGGGFENLNQVRRMLNVDVVALVGYDQTQFTDENFLSLSYWTIVGAYIFKGNVNDTHTIMEAAVYDIASEHLLFRAGGASQVKGSAAAKYVTANLQEDAGKGFEQATTDLILNLQAELGAFRERLKQSPGEVKVERRPGYTGSGDFGPGFVGLLALLGAAAWLRRKH